MEPRYLNELTRATVDEPHDPVGWLALADAMEEQGRPASLERANGLILLTCRTLQIVPLLPGWVSVDPDGRAGIGHANGDCFAWRAPCSLVWLAGPSGPHWSAWESADGSRWVHLSAARAAWERCWRAQVMLGDGVPVEVSVSWVAYAPLLDVLTDMKTHGDVLRGSTRAWVCPDGGPSSSHGHWLHWRDGAWFRRRRDLRTPGPGAGPSPLLSP